MPMWYWWVAERYTGLGHFALARNDAHELSQSKRMEGGALFVLRENVGDAATNHAHSGRWEPDYRGPAA